MTHKIIVNVITLIDVRVVLRDYNLTRESQHVISSLQLEIVFLFESLVTRIRVS